MEQTELAATAKVVVITGAGQGLGRAYALRFASMGHHIAALDINADSLARVAHEVQALGQTCLPLTVDIGDAAAVAHAGQQIDARFGRADILINNAAIFSSLKMRPFEEIPLDEWSRVLHVNVTGTMLTVKALLPLMRRHRWGRVINISSAAVVMGRANYLHYTTSKAAVIGMTRSLARELGPHGITVNVVLPGATDTEVARETVTPAQKQAQISMRCIPREENTDDVTGAVVFLASEDSRFITGQSLVVDGGLTFL